jgi:hypothetical protein
MGCENRQVLVVSSRFPKTNEQLSSLPATPLHCKRCKSRRLVAQDYEDKPLAWTYRRDVLGEDWPTLPDLSNALCYVCYIKEVLQWASSIY